MAKPIGDGIVIANECMGDGDVNSYAGRIDDGDVNASYGNI